MKRIEKGPVRGISIKLQEEERERRDNFVPDVSAIAADGKIEVDNETREMLREIGFGSLPGLTVVNPATQNRGDRGDRGDRGGKRN
jgi:small subunit ribosomal protein S17e